jgi:hypothetical protein
MLSPSGADSTLSASAGRALPSNPHSKSELKTRAKYSVCDEPVWNGLKFVPNCRPIPTVAEAELGLGADVDEDAAVCVPAGEVPPVVGVELLSESLLQAAPRMGTLAPATTAPVASALRRLMRRCQ